MIVGVRPNRERCASSVSNAQTNEHRLQREPQRGFSRDGMGWDVGIHHSGLDVVGGFLGCHSLCIADAARAILGGIWEG
jgi:hypothetical protein